LPQPLLLRMPLPLQLPLPLPLPLLLPLPMQLPLLLRLPMQLPLPLPLLLLPMLLRLLPLLMLLLQFARSCILHICCGNCYCVQARAAPMIASCGRCLILRNVYEHVESQHFACRYFRTTPT
jgi:hypothetical protein